jgi:endonuclease/exonuclease/phosphatase family metal-dependent hydrolase
VHRITVGSYNIHSCVGLDRRRSPARIAKVLEELDCDIYALQEVHNDLAPDGSRQLEYLSSALGMTAVPGLRIVKHRAEYGNAILTRFPVLDVGRHDLSVPRLEPRGALDVELDAGDCRLRVIATHLGLSRKERRVQWQHLLAAVGRAPPELPVVLVGDMNEWYRHSVMLRDAHRILGEALAPTAFPSFAPFLALTRIWVRPASAIVAIEVHRSAAARRASDHLPLKAVVDVRELTRMRLGAEDAAGSDARPPPSERS